MKTLNVVLIALGMLCSPAQAATYTLTPADANKAHEALYQTPLPLSVYLQSRAFSLGDVSIHNAAGESLPYAVVPYARTHPQPATVTQDLKFIALQAEQMADTQALSVAIQAQSGNIHIETTGANKSITPPVYLVDLGEKHAAVQALTLAWSGAEAQLVDVAVLASDDLRSWHNVGQGVLLQAQQIQLQNRLALDSAITVRYLQIKPAQALQLISLSASQQAVSAKPEILWQNTVFLAREQGKNANQINVDFESPSLQAADYIDVTLPDDNTITQATVLVRDDENAPWQYVANAALYRMHKNGKTYQHAPIIMHSVARYWRLQFNQQNGGIGQQNPQLRLGWLGDSLVWNARGQAPFSLHVDEGEKPNLVSLNALLPEGETQVTHLPIANAQASTTDNAPAANTDKASSNPWVRAPDYKRWLLWAGLLLGVLLLAGMVRSLLKK